MNHESGIDSETWVILAERLDATRRAREALEAPPEREPELVFDIHDQATLKQ